MIGELFGQNAGWMIAAVYLALFLFGVAFNVLTSLAERNGYIHGYTSLFVAAGVLITLLGVALISLPFALLTLGAFAASGTPMIIGSIARYMQERRRQIEQLRQEVRRDDPEEEVAA